MQLLKDSKIYIANLFPAMKMEQMPLSIKPGEVQIRDDFIFNFLSENRGGIRLVDKLILDQLQYHGEEIYIIHKKTGILAKFRDLFSPSGHDIHRVRTKEDDLANVLDGIVAGNLSLLGGVEEYLQERHEMRSRISYEQTGIKQTEASLVYSILLVERLRKGYNNKIANELKQFMERNVFSEGVISENTPKKIWENLIGTVHFHIARQYLPPSTNDLITSHNAPSYVGAYSIDNNNTKIYSLHNGSSDEIGILRNSASVHELSKTVTEPPNVSINYKNEQYIIDMDSETGLMSMLVMGRLYGERTYRVLTSQEFDNTLEESLGMKFQKVRIDYLVAFVLDKDYKCGIASLKAA